MYTHPTKYNVSMRKQRRRRDLKRGCLCSLCSRVAAKMGDEEFRRRQLANTKTQFDYKPPGIDVNLIMGCPPNHLLQKASFHFQAALNHRMVRSNALLNDLFPRYKFYREVLMPQSYSSMALRLVNWNSELSWRNFCLGTIGIQ